MELPSRPRRVYAPRWKDFRSFDKFLVHLNFSFTLIYRCDRKNQVSDLCENIFFRVP